MATETRRLRMTFVTTQGARRSISIANPVENPVEAEVDGLMDTILSKNIFETPAGDFDSKAGAVLVTTETAEIVAAPE